jgi:oligopeptide transport system substrate-binding protein
MLRKLFLAAFTLSFLISCTASQAPENRIRMRLPAEPPTLDWGLATDNISKEVIINMHSGLLIHDSETRVQPSLAESYEISPDGKTYTFKIRPDAKWSDGQELTAQHFVDAWERVLNPQTASEYAYFLFDVINASEYQAKNVTDFSQVGVKALDPKTLEVRLKTPAAYWIHIPTFWITYPIRNDIVEKHGDRWTDPAHIVSAGPYKLLERQTDSRILLGLNPHFHDLNESRIPEIEFRIVKDDSVAISLFDTGALDIVRTLPPSQLRHLSQKPEFKEHPYLRQTYFGFNLKDKSVENVAVRKALALAIDRSEIEQLLQPLGRASKVWIPLSLKGSDPQRGLDYNLEEAQKIWASLKNPPTKLEVVFDQQETYKLVAENLQNQWKRKLGVEIVLSSQEWKVYLKQLSSQAPALFRLGWGADYPDPDTFMALFSCRSGNNHTGFCNTRYDQLIIEAGQSRDPQQRQALYSEAQRILLEEEIALIPLFQEQSLHMVSQRVKGFSVDLLGDFFFYRFRF